jgi:hypothetical protein
MQPVNQDALDKFKKKYQHDAFCKEKLRDVMKARKFLKYLLKPEVQELLDIRRLEIDPESFVDDELKRSYADVVYRIPLKDSDESIVVFILIELKTDNDRWTIFQLMKYVVRIWERELKKVEDADKESKRLLKTFLLPMVIPIIFHHGEDEFTAPTELVELVRVLNGMESFTLNMQSLLFDLVPLKQQDFPDDVELYVLFMVLQAVFSTDVVDRLMEIYRKLRPTLHSSKSQKEWRDSLFYAVTSAKHFTHDKCENLIKQTEKEGVLTMSTSVIDEIYANGIAKGEVKGEVNFGRNAVLAVLRTRFKKVPKRIETAVKQMNSPIALESLTVHAATCQTLDEFSDALN